MTDAPPMTPTTTEAAEIASLTPRQMDVARHALGMGGKSPGYRNYFCAAPGFDDDLTWQSMVEIGAAWLISTPRDWMPHNTYAVTPAVRQAIMENAK